MAKGTSALRGAAKRAGGSVRVLQPRFAGEGRQYEMRFPGGERTYRAPNLTEAWAAVRRQNDRLYMQRKREQWAKERAQFRKWLDREQARRSSGYYGVQNG